MSCAIASIVYNADTPEMEFIRKRYTTELVNTMNTKYGHGFFVANSKMLDFIAIGRLPTIDNSFFDKHSCYFCKTAENDIIHKDVLAKLFEFRIPQKNFEHIYPSGKICDECLYHLFCEVNETDIGEFDCITCAECQDDYLADPYHAQTSRFSKQKYICDDCLSIHTEEAYCENDNIVLNTKYQAKLVCDGCMNVSEFDLTTIKELNLFIRLNKDRFICDGICGQGENYLTRNDNDILTPLKEVIEQTDDLAKLMDNLRKIDAINENIKAPSKDNNKDFNETYQEGEWFINIYSYNRKNEWYLTFEIVVLNEDREIKEIITSGTRNISIKYENNNSITEVVNLAYEYHRQLLQQKTESQLSLEFQYD